MSDSRYSRQTRFAALGSDGQRLLERSRVLIAGCGALGSSIAERLARAGVGHLRIVDRDWVELSNLQRQCLFTEAHAASRSPKAIAACETLATINSSIQYEPIVDDLRSETMEALVDGCDLVLDGTDNFETRFLINDVCVKTHTPWVHGGCIGAGGQTLTIVPHETACFRCLLPELPPRDASQTCDSAGVLGTAIGVIASWQAGEALKILSGNSRQVCRDLVVFDFWNNDVRMVKLRKHEGCPTCGKDDYPFLRGEIETQTAILCGKNAVQIVSPAAAGETLEQLTARLQGTGRITQNSFFVRIELESYSLTVFRGGRTVVEGTTSEAEAKSVIAQTLGS